MRLRLRSRLCAIDLFAPEIALPIGALVFLGIGLYSTKIFPDLSASPRGILVYLLGISAYLIGIKLVSRIEIKKNVVLSNVLIGLSALLVTLFLWVNNMPWVIGPLLPLMVLYAWKNKERAAYPLIVSGLGLFLLNLYVYGVPIIDNALRAQGFNLLWISSIGLFLLGYVMRLERASPREIVLLTCSGLLFLLGGYRGPIILLILNMLIMLYYRETLKNRHLALAIIALVTFTILFGWYQQNLGMDPTTLIAHRLGYTYHRYDQIVNVLSPLGPGQVLTQADPRYAIGELTTDHWRSTNSALFGIVWADSGIVGLLAVFTGLGAATKVLFSRRNGLYSLWLAYLLLAIEAGVDLNYVMLAPSLLGLLYRK